MIFGSACSGISAASVAWDGWRCAWFSETNTFCRRVLKHRWPDVPNLGDMNCVANLIREGVVQAPDVLIGGTPCQSFSVAGKRGGLNDKRGNLALVFAEIADAIDETRAAQSLPPAWILWENVPGVFTRGFGTILGRLVGASAPLVPPEECEGWRNAGVAAGPRRTAAWRVLDAQFFGVAQRRRRVFVLARGGPRTWASAGALLPFAQGLRRHPPSRGEAGPPTAALTACGVGVGGADDNSARGGRLIFDAIQITSKDNRSDPQPGDPCHTLAAHSRSMLVTSALTTKPYADHGDGDFDRLVVQGTQDPDVATNTAHCLGTNSGQENALFETNTVRRLTPRESERLQGFPDNHTLISRAKDSLRYKAIGNSMAVPVIRWIGRRIEEYDGS